LDNSIQKNNVSRKELLATSLIVFSVLAVLNYWPVLIGKVPFPSYILRFFLPWHNTDPAKPIDARYAELGDLISMFYPWRAFAAEAIRKFDLPLWNNHILAGAPFVANGQSAIFYPINFLYYLLPTNAAWSLRLFLLVICSGCFTAVFVEAIGGSVAGSIAAGIVYSMGGFVSAWQGWAHADAAMWLPLMLFCVHKLASGPSFRRVLLAAVCFSMPVLAGHPETAIHVTVLALAYAILRFLPVTRGDLTRSGKALAGFGLAGLLAAGIASAQLLPTGEWVGGLTHRSDLIWPPAHVNQIMGLVSRDNRGNPNSAGVSMPESGAYIGMLALLLLFLAPLHRNKRDVLFFAIVIAAGIQLIVGWGPLRELAIHTPVIKGLKPTRLWILVDFSCAVLGGLGLSVLESVQISERRKRAGIYALIGLGISTGIFGMAALVRYTHVHTEWSRSPYASIALLTAAGILLLLRIRSSLSPQQFKLAALALISIDLLTYTYGYIPFSDPASIFPKAPLLEFLQRQDTKHYRVASLDNAIGPNWEMMYGLSTPEGYELTLERSQSFLRDFSYFALDGITFRADQVGALRDRRLDLMNVKYLITSTQNAADALSSQPGRFSSIYTEGPLRIFENKTVLPRAFLVPASDVQVLTLEDDQLLELSNPGFDPARNVLMFSTPAVYDGRETASVQSHLTGFEEGLNKVTLEAEANVPSILVISQTFYPGWNVYVDGQPAGLFRTDYTLTGVALKRGRHHVELRFQPASVRIGMAISFFTICGVLTTALVGGWRRQRLPRIAVWLSPLPAILGVAGIALAVTTTRTGAIEAPGSDVASVTSVQIDRTPVAVHFKNPIESVAGTARMDAGSDAVGGIATFAYANMGEWAAPAARPGKAFVVPVELHGNIRTALAIANSAGESATVTYSCQSGHRNGTLTLPPNGQVTAFLDEGPFNIAPFQDIGTIVLTSSVPIAVSPVVLSQESESSFKIASMPAADESVGNLEKVYVPLMTEGTTGTAQLILTNPTGMPTAGHQKWFDESGKLWLDRAYALAPQSAITFDSPDSFRKGFVEIAPEQLNSTPSAVALLFTRESGKPSLITSFFGQSAATDPALYVDGSKDASMLIMLSNPSPKNAFATVTGQSSTQDLSIPGFATVETTVELTRSARITIHSDSPLTAVAVNREIVAGHQRSVSTIPPLTFSKSVALFPQLALGGWFRTRLLVVLTSSGQGSMRFFDPKGQPLKLGVSVW
jgi:hypothetical protein